jgi:hypothetical protein
MISVSQRKMVQTPAARKLLNAMWEQRRRWWFNHLLGHHDREAVAAAKAARLHAELRSATGLPELVIKDWERTWDDWFEKHLRFLVTE